MAILSRLLRITVFATAFGLTPTVGHAQTYPSQHIHFICTAPPGSGADVMVRFFAGKIAQLAGATVIVDNKPGATGNLAMEFVSRAKPDGYTVLVGSATAVALSMHLFKRPPFPDAGKALTPAATIVRAGTMMVVDAKSPYGTLADLTAAMKLKGEKATYGTSISISSIMGSLYNSATGAKAVEVVYKSGPDGLNDLLNGAVDYGIYDPPFSLAQRRENRLRILGISTGERVQASPDIPTMAEQGVPMDLTIWWAAMVPAGTPKPIVDQLNKWFVAVVSSNEGKAFLTTNAGDPLIETPEQGQERLLKDVVRWGEYVRAAGIKPRG